MFLFYAVAVKYIQFQECGNKHGVNVEMYFKEADCDSVDRIQLAENRF
jgi:hypothetical protein